MPAVPPPLPLSSGLVSFRVKAGGQALDNLLSLTITKGINRITEAQLELVDGDPSTDLPLRSAADQLAAGTEVVIEIGYDNQLNVLFKGIVVMVSIAGRGAQGSMLRVLCKDAAVQLTGPRKVLAFPPNAPLSEALAQVLEAYPALETDLTATAVPLPSLLQYNRTDWDFLVTQAEAVGQVVLNDQGRVSTRLLNTNGEPVAALVNGTNLYDYRLRLDARTQVAAVVAQSWSGAEQRAVTATANDPGLTAPGTAATAAQATALGQPTYTLRTAADLDQGTLQTLADAYLAKRILAKVQGFVDFPGTHLVVPGSLVQLEGLGSSFDGPAYVAAVTHTLSSSDWKTQATLGTDEQWFAERHPEVGLPATATPLAAGVAGLYTAVVKTIAPDERGSLRVQVTVASLDEAALWVRLAQPYASEGAGLFFYPEVNDEVVLGFLGDDVRHPIILGSLHSAKRPPAYSPDENNTRKAIVTKSGLTLEFDDENKAITLRTPGNNRLVISDEDKSITLTDQHNNSIRLSESGISIESPTGLTLSAGNDMKLSATSGGLALETAGLLEAKATSISLAAASQLTLSSKGTAELTAAATVTVQGAMVMIN